MALYGLPTLPFTLYVLLMQTYSEPLVGRLFVTAFVKSRMQCRTFQWVDALFILQRLAETWLLVC